MRQEKQLRNSSPLTNLAVQNSCVLSLYKPELQRENFSQAWEVAMLEPTWQELYKPPS